MGAVCTVFSVDEGGRATEGRQFGGGVQRVEVLGEKRMWMELPHDLLPWAAAH